MSVTSMRQMALRIPLKQPTTRPLRAGLVPSLVLPTMVFTMATSAVAKCVETDSLTSACVAWSNGPPAVPEPMSLVDQQRPKALAKGPTPKIIGGLPARLEDNSWQVSLVKAGAKSMREGHFCGGSNIGGGWVLTAAHCVDRGTLPADIRVYSGSASLEQGGRLAKVAKIVVHPEWDPHPRRLRNDIALLWVEGGGASLMGQPVLGPKGVPEPLLGALPVRSTGWGLTMREPDDLPAPEMLQVDLPYVQVERCNSPAAYGGLVTKQMLCLGPEDSSRGTCGGDSGGPATVDFAGARRLVGIVSFGKRGCNQPHGYSVFTRVSAYADWIVETTSRGNPNTPGGR